jgi:copper resistance protein C
MLARKTVTVKTTLAIVVASIIGGMAHAHPALETAVPGDGATVSSPKEIRLTFTENLIAKFSGLTVKDQSGQLVETAAPIVDPNNKSHLIVPIARPLPPGTYNVDWHAVAADTHRVTGHFSFKVAQ